jgi:casein kinase 1
VAKISDPTFCKDKDKLESLWYFIIVEQYGKNLECYASKKLSSDEVYQVAIQVLCQLEIIHESGYVHCDLKPANITVGQVNDSCDKIMRVRLIDFGICKRFLDKNGDHVKPKFLTKFMGTLNFVSAHVMSGLNPVRRDDLISLAYMLLFLLNESPIDAIIDKGYTIEKNFSNILKLKKQLTVDKMCSSEKTAPLKPFFEEIFSYKFSDTPYYKKLRHQLTVLLLDKNKLPQESVIERNDKENT